MIKAGEARELVLLADNSVEKVLSELDPKIRKAASEGSCKLAFYPFNSYNMKLWDAKPVSTFCAANVFQQRVIDALKQLGFSAAVEADGEAYVPRGLQDEDGNGPFHVNHCIVVRW